MHVGAETGEGQAGCGESEPTCAKDAGSGTVPCTLNFGDPKSSLEACQGCKEEGVDPLHRAGAPQGTPVGSGCPQGGCGEAARWQRGGNLPEPAPDGSICLPKWSLEIFQTTN